MIREIAETTSVKTLQELAAETEKRLGKKFTVSMVRRRLELHPVLAKKIQKKLDEKKHLIKSSESKIKGTTLAAPPTVKTEVPEEPAKPAEPKTAPSEVKQNFYAIDASICGCEEAMEFIKDIKKDGVLVITSITISELMNLSDGTDSAARDAHNILKQFFLFHDSDDSPFLEVDVGDGKTLSNEERDDMIIENCKDLYILTADFGMAYKCHKLGIKYKFFEHKTCYTYHTRIISLKPVTKTKNELFFRDSSSPTKRVFVKDENEETAPIEIMPNMANYTELKKGYKIYISSIKKLYCTFAVYEVINTEQQNNAKLVCAKRYTNKSELPEEYQEYAI